MSTSKNQSSWKRKLTKQEKANCRQAAKEIQKIKNQKGLTTLVLSQILTRTRNFIGVYAENELKYLTVTSFPSFIVCNIDKSSEPGSHWIALGIFRHSLEVFDSSGFKIFLWSRVPCNLLNFIHKLSLTRKVIVSNRLQSIKSTLCGFYCILYILARNCITLRQINSLFSKRLAQNDLVIKNIF